MELLDDKVRFLDQKQDRYSITALELSLCNAKEKFVTFWIKPGHENRLLKEIGPILWPDKKLIYRHCDSVFHRDDVDSTWSVTRHHYHVPTDDIMKVIRTIQNISHREYISPKLIEQVEKYLQLGE
ncbi:MAG: hypothetical protein ACFFD1_00120 [Candidatus Thorarchaeota archaeon]